MKDYIWAALFILVFVGIIFFAVIDGLSPRNWYADKHDDKCDKLTGKSTCDCYKRFVKGGEK